MNKGSTYWLKETRNNKENFNLIELANTQRAITNFVKIQTGEEIPVDFYSNNEGDSMTDGNRITISSIININNLDSIIGLALHESAHCVYTNFQTLKKISNRLAPDNLLGGRLQIELLLNFIEDRRIDDLCYKMAPGYQNYYKSMYKRYFYNKIISKGLKSKKYREENWESYLFRIINIFNKNTDLKALSKLKDIYKLIDLKNINRLENTTDSLELAITTYKILNSHFASMDSKKRAKQEYNNRKNAQESKNTTKGDIKKVFRKQEQFINGNIHKTHTTKKDKQIINTICESNIKVKDVKVKRTICPVHILEGITPSIIESNLYNVFNQSHFSNKEYIEQGINLGKKLLRKLRIRNEQITLASKRLKSGKIDPRRIYAANFEEDLFYKIDKSNYKPISLHVSIDGSQSMEGQKWKQVLINTIALGYISLFMDNIDLTISIRTTGKDLNKSSQTAQIPLLILAFNSKKNNLKDLKRLQYCKPTGLTPEGMCLTALNEYIPNSSYYLDSYLINLSDGYPTFEYAGLRYRGEEAILDTTKIVNKIKKKGVKILSYFIGSNINKTKDNELIENFRTMYGKGASFINPKNINEVTKTLNNLFLEKNLIS